MTTLWIIFCVVAWLNLGILVYRSTSDLGHEPLESMVLPLRLLVILLAPLGLLIFERHLFYKKAEPEQITIKK